MSEEALDAILVTHTIVSFRQHRGAIRASIQHHHSFASGLPAFLPATLPLLPLLASRAGHMAWASTALGGRWLQQ